MIRRPRERDEAHLTFIRQLPCLVCHNNIETEAAHVRFGCMAVGKPNTGIGEKPSDNWTVPLCSEHHREQHLIGERNFWKSKQRDPVTVAMALWINSGRAEVAHEIIARAAAQ